MSAEILDCLRNSSTIADQFWGWCEFAALDEEAPPWFALESKESLQVVGRDACGGRLCLFPASQDYSGRLLYVDSEGQAGVIADSLSDGIRMMIALPNWRDCLHFSGGGKIEEMKRALFFSPTSADLEISRQSLYRAFGLTEMANPVERLFQAVSSGANARVVGTKDGWPFESLFNKFVVDDNPLWKQSSRLAYD